MAIVLLIVGLVAGSAGGWWLAGLRRPIAAPVASPGESDPVAHEVGELASLRAALDALPLGVVYADAHGRVLLRNRLARAATGVRHGDILVDEAVEAHLRAAAAGEVRRQSLELIGPPSRVLVIRAQPVEGGGAVAIVEDITERARLDAVRTDFVANISHELKTPVGAVLLLAETLAESDEPEVIERLAGRILRESDRLSRTIDDLLELSRIELGGEGLRELVSVGLVMAEAADRVRHLADRRHIRLTVVEPSSSLTAVGDRRQLVSALGNLIENAVKYSETDSEVTVGATHDGTMVAFSVTDRGIGIPAQHLDRIFERFYRVDRARSRETGGTGLGLAIVRHVATNHGGQVSVTSQEGEGSTFTLKIPAGPTPAVVEYPIAG